MGMGMEEGNGNKVRFYIVVFWEVYEYVMD